MLFLKRGLLVSLFVALNHTAVLAESFESYFPEVHGVVDDETRLVLDRIIVETGNVVIGDNLATISLPENYYYLGPNSSKVVLEDIWGNPPSEPPLGMIFPRETSPLHDGWGLTIDYDPMGYVSDSDAEDIDYADLLSEMKQDTLEGNKARRELGYPSITLLGWAEPPRYDAATREFYWAQELQFEGYEANTLNYNVRELGRRGVLVVNFIAGIDQLANVKAALPDVLKMVEFNEGNRYADFIPGTDTVAAVGLGGLVAGKVMAKAGLFVVLLALLKKGGFLIFLPLIWLGKKIFGRGKPASS